MPAQGSDSSLRLSLRPEQIVQIFSKAIGIDRGGAPSMHVHPGPPGGIPAQAGLHPRPANRLLYGVDEIPSVWAILLLRLPHGDIFAVSLPLPVVIKEARLGLGYATRLVNVRMIAAGIGSVVQARGAGRASPEFYAHRWVFSGVAADSAAWRQEEALVPCATLAMMVGFNVWRRGQLRRFCDHGRMGHGRQIRTRSTLVEGPASCW